MTKEEVKKKNEELCDEKNRLVEILLTIHFKDGDLEFNNGEKCLAANRAAKNSVLRAQSWPS